MAVKRKLTDWNDCSEEDVVVVADASDDVTEEHIHAIEDAVRHAVEGGNWTIVEGPGW